MKRFSYPHTPVALLLLLCLSMTPSLVWTQGLPGSNLADLYKADSPEAELLLWQSSTDSLTVFARLTQETGLSQPEGLQLLFFSSADSGRQAYDSLPLRSIGSSKEFSYLRTTFPTSDNLHSIALKGRKKDETGGRILAMAVANPAESFPPPSFYLSGGNDSLPVVETFAASNSPLLLTGEDTTYTVFLYQNAFEPAAPPMSALPAASDALSVDSIFQLSAGSTFIPAAEGLYFFQKDTSRMSGHSIRITNPYFPEVGTLEDLSGPVRYISTREEWNRLTKSNFSKEAVDRFWLKLGKTEGRTRAMIKDYYNGVEAANRYFTNYKEGWKTDRGMIYILYGAPDVVEVKDGQEEWIYHKTADNPEIKFTFVRVKNPFTDSHFVLIRRKEYTKAHYDTISQWRRGRKTL